MQKFVHGFERAEKAGEALPQMRGRFACRYKIAMAKQIRYRDDRRSHGAIFVRTLCPGDTLLRIDPNCEPHLRPLRQKHLRLHRLAVTQHLDRHSVAGLVRPQRVGEIVKVVNLVAVKFD